MSHKDVSEQPAAHSFLDPHSVEDSAQLIDSGTLFPINRCTKLDAFQRADNLCLGMLLTHAAGGLAAAFWLSIVSTRTRNVLIEQSSMLKAAPY